MIIGRLQLRWLSILTLVGLLAGCESNSPNDAFSEIIVIKFPHVTAQAKQKIIDSERTEVVQLTETETLEWQQIMRPVWKQFEHEIGTVAINTALSISSQWMITERSTNNLCMHKLTG